MRGGQLAEVIDNPRLIYVKYVDHVLFRNANPSQIKPIIREAIGWIVRENDEAIWICFDKQVNEFSYEKTDYSSGLIILKNGILEIKKLSDIYAFFKTNLSSSSTNKIKSPMFRLKRFLALMGIVTCPFVLSLHMPSAFSTTGSHLHRSNVRKYFNNLPPTLLTCKYAHV